MNIFTTIGEWWKRINAPSTTEQQIQTALKNLLRDDQESYNRWKYINTYLPALGFEIIAEELPGQSEAQTRVFSDHVVIAIDIEKIKRLRDCPEAVIGHELKHADDAFTMGLGRYIETVNAQRDKDWWHKDVELDAIDFEDRLRARLRATGNYNSIAPTRAEQNRRAHI